MAVSNARAALAERRFSAWLVGDHMYTHFLGDRRTFRKLRIETMSWVVRVSPSFCPSRPVRSSAYAMPFARTATSTPGTSPAEASSYPPPPPASLVAYVSARSATIHHSTGLMGSP